MKKENTQAGFMPILAALIALLVIGGGIYAYSTTKVNTPSITITTEAVSTTTSVGDFPMVISMNPSTGKAGTLVTVNVDKGEGFDKSSVIVFGTGEGQSNIQPEVISKDGSRLQFRVPNYPMNPGVSFDVKVLTKTLVSSTAHFVVSGTPQVDENGILGPGMTRASGFVKKVYTKADKNYIDVDYVTFKKCDSPDGDSCLVNENPMVRTIEVSPDVKILIMGIYQQHGLSQEGSINWQEFKNIFISTDGEDYRKLNPWDLTIQNNTVIQLKENFRP